MTRTDPLTPAEDLDAALRALDVADDRLSAEQAARKDALLATLLAEPTAPAAGGSTRILTEGQRAVVVARRRRRRAVRWVAPVLAAAAAATWFAWPGAPVPGGGEASRIAFASWTSTPSPVDAATRVTAENACRDQVREQVEHLQREVPDQAPTVDPAAMRGVLSDRRGRVVFVHLAAADGSSLMCFGDSARPQTVRGISGGLATTHSDPPVALRPDQIEMSSGALIQDESGTFAASSGRVGRDVRAVTIRSAGKVVTATVGNGHVAAWWPTSPRPANSPAPRETYDLTLVDGRVIRDAPNVFDSGEQKVGPRQVGRITTGGGAGDGGPVVTLGGEVGAEVTKVVVHVGGKTVEAPLVDQVFAVELPEGTDTSSATFDLTLRDGSVLEGQRPVGR